MGQLRGLMYFGFIIVTVAGWYISRRRNHVAPSDYLPKVPQDAAEITSDTLKHSNWTIRLQALQTLLENPTDDMLNILLEMIDDPIIDIRTLASEALIAYKDEALAGLDNILKTHKLPTRESAMQAVLKIHTPATRPLLIDALLQDESAWIRVPAAQGLGQLGGDEAYQALLLARADSHPDVVEAVNQALEKMGKPQTAKAIKS